MLIKASRPLFARFSVRPGSGAGYISCAMRWPKPERADVASSPPSSPPPLIKRLPRPPVSNGATSPTRSGRRCRSADLMDEADLLDGMERGKERVSFPELGNNCCRNWQPVIAIGRRGDRLWRQPGNRGKPSKTGYVRNAAVLDLHNWRRGAHRYRFDQQDN